MQPDLFIQHTRLAVGDMGQDEVVHRLKDALRDGRIGEDNRGFVLGYFAALKRPKGPSVKQDQIARKLVRETRYEERYQSIKLVDTGDTLVDEDDAPALVGDEWSEFK